MRICEVVVKKKQVIDVQPAPVQRQQRINQVVKQIAASDQQQQPTEMDKILAMRQYNAMKQQTNMNYANNLQQQLATLPSNKREKR